MNVDSIFLEKLGYVSRVDKGTTIINIEDAILIIIADLETCV